MALKVERLDNQNVPAFVCLYFRPNSRGRFHHYEMIIMDAEKLLILLLDSLQQCDMWLFLQETHVVNLAILITVSFLFLAVTEWNYQKQLAWSGTA